nr:restriction endonuclease subunit S [uncultured Draconibacterium sp.]
MEQLITRTYLKNTRLKLLENWSVQYLLESKFSYNENFELVPIGSFLIKSRLKTLIEDEKTYQRVTVKINNNGVVPRDTELGKNIGTKQQYLVKSGQFLMSKIDARNGAFGLVPKNLDGAIVTNDFPVFDVEGSVVNPEFLVLITTTKEFIKFAQSCSSGTTNRQRIDLDMFLNVKIPLPSLPEQNRIVETCNDKIKLAAEQEQRAGDLEKGIKEYLFKIIGISNENAQNSLSEKGLRIISYSEINKWGLDFIGKIQNNIENEFQVYRIKNLCKISSGGTPSRSKKQYYNGKIPWIKTGELKDEILYDTEEKITEEGLNNSSAKLYSANSLVVAMYGATIGKTAKLGIESTTNQACAVLFDINNDIIVTDFLWFYIQSQIDELKKLAYGSAQPNLNAGTIANFIVYVPDLDLQKEIVDKIFVMKSEIKLLREKSAHNKERAIKEFEDEIFKR